MKVIRDARDMQVERRSGCLASGSVGFVATMGALHDGHLALIRLSREVTDLTVVSIFVNPTQFHESADFSQYPRTLDQDLARCEAAGVAVVFCPHAEDMYAADASVQVVENQLSCHLCGADRPGHFSGVCTVVAKLFHLVSPDVAVFGQKDAQQLAVIRRMVRDLFFPVRILSAPIVREPDGLALSSRNAHLSQAEHTDALGLYKALCLVQEQFRAGEGDAATVDRHVRHFLAQQYPSIALAYLTFRHPHTLALQVRLEQGTLVAIAARVGHTRLIDNILLA